MIKQQIVVALAATALLYGCSKETHDPSSKVALRVNAEIATRVHDNKWDANDAIGIYMQTADQSGKADNHKYTTTQADGHFAPATADQTIYFPIDGSNVSFTAYYPHTSTFGPTGALMLDMSSQTDLKAIDLMVAQGASTPLKPLNKDNPAVSLNFTHRLTKLELTINAGVGVSIAELSGLTVLVTNQRTNASYNPLLDTFGVEADPVLRVPLNTSTDGSKAEAILLPTTEDDGINPILPNRELIFILQSQSVFRWPVPDTKSFNSGDKNIYNITINRTGLEITSTIVNWNPGNGENGESGDAE